MKKVLLLIAVLLTAPALVSAHSIWDSISHTVTHTANSVSHSVTHTEKSITKAVIPKKDMPAIHKIIKINHQANEGVLHSVTGACSSVLDEIISKAIGKSCTAFNAEFSASCNAALDAETVGAGMAICGTATGIIATQCKGVVKEELGPAVTNAAC